MFRESSVSTHDFGEFCNPSTRTHDFCEFCESSAYTHDFCRFCHPSARTHDFCECTTLVNSAIHQLVRMTFCESSTRTHDFFESLARTRDLIVPFTSCTIFALTKYTPLFLIKGSCVSPHFKAGCLYRCVSIPCSHRQLTLRVSFVTSTTWKSYYLGWLPVLNQICFFRNLGVFFRPHVEVELIRLISQAQILQTTWDRH